MNEEKILRSYEHNLSMQLRKFRSLKKSGLPGLQP